MLDTAVTQEEGRRRSLTPAGRRAGISSAGKAGRRGPPRLPDEPFPPDGEKGQALSRLVRKVRVCGGRGG